MNTQYRVAGSGHAGRTLARLFARAGIDAPIANSRGPESLTEIATDLGQHVVPLTIERALDANVISLAAGFMWIEAVVAERSNWTGKLTFDVTNALQPAEARGTKLRGPLSCEINAKLVAGAKPKPTVTWLGGRPRAAHGAITRGYVPRGVCSDRGSALDAFKPQLGVLRMVPVLLLTLDYLVNYHARMGRISNAKERLMDAATELTWQKGYNAVTVDDICERAGVQKGSFYYFFKSKAALAIAAMENWWQTKTRPNLDSAFSASRPPLERLKAYFELIHQHYLDQKETGGRMLGCPFFSLAMEGGGLEPEVLHASQQYVKRKRKYLEAAIRDAQAEGLIEISSVEEATQGLQTLMEGALAMARVQNDLGPLRGLYKEALRLLGVRQPVVTA